MPTAKNERRLKQIKAAIVDPLCRHGGSLKIDHLPDWVCDDLGLPRNTDLRRRRHHGVY